MLLVSYFQLCKKERFAYCYYVNSDHWYYDFSVELTVAAVAGGDVVVAVSAAVVIAVVAAGGGDVVITTKSMALKDGGGVNNIPIGGFFFGTSTFAL